ncbi:AEC family transporter [Pseudonocardia yunnanensis]|uniref:AEC family transporter n=1 Tax=Pseudonocardia yunnanensis TaxID=58107 RepID=A0ABW4EWF2_9PSEU
MIGLADILTIVVPVFVVVAVGYCVGRMRLFDGGRAQALRDLTIQLALPAVLFVSIVNTPRSVLLGQGPLVGLLALGLLGLYAILVLALRFGARLTIQRSALLALACVQPQFAFMGISILGGLFGPRQAAIPIAVAGILVNVVLVPVALILLNLRSRTHATAEITAVRTAAPVLVGAAGGPPPPAADRAPTVPGASGALPAHSGTGAVLARVLGPLREPLAWAPLLGLVLAFVGVHPYTIISSSLTLIGGASSAAALLFVGITVARAGRPRLSLEVWAIALASVVAQPLLTWVVGQWITTGAIAAQAALITAFPISPVAMMLASRQGTKKDEQVIASAVALTLVLSFVTLPLMIHLTR